MSEYQPLKKPRAWKQSRRHAAWCRAGKEQFFSPSPLRLIKPPCRGDTGLRFEFQLGPAPITQLPPIQCVPKLPHLPLTGGNMLHLPPWFCEVINPSGHTTSMLNSSEKKKTKNFRLLSLTYPALGSQPLCISDLPSPGPARWNSTVSWGSHAFPQHPSLVSSIVFWGDFLILPGIPLTTQCWNYSSSSFLPGAS